MFINHGHDSKSIFTFGGWPILLNLVLKEEKMVSKKIKVPSKLKKLGFKKIHQDKDGFFMFGFGIFHAFYFKDKFLGFLSALILLLSIIGILVEVYS